MILIIMIKITILMMIITIIEIITLQEPLCALAIVRLALLHFESYMPEMCFIQFTGLGQSLMLVCT